MAISLYIHIPFCARKCAYCDFVSYANCDGALPGYLTRLYNEMSENSGHALQTVFIGGGTPSLLSGEQVIELMRHVRQNFDLLPDAEVTIEANPGTLDPEKLNAYRASGINRLSMGVQAKQAHLLSILGRIHTWSDVEKSMTMARAAGFTNINLDLMYALPNQTMTDWTDTVSSAIQLNPEHISAYSLILEPDTPLAKRTDLIFPDDDTAVEMQRIGTKLLKNASLLRYEISNYAKKDYECRHNIAYWTRAEYLGLGTAAHSLMGNARFSNSDELDYQRELNTLLTERDAFEENVMLGTRMVRGIESNVLNMEKIERLKALGLVKTDKALLSLTEKGMELHNQVVMELIG